MQLPPDLLKALSDVLADFPQRDLIDAVRTLSLRYRAGHDVAIEPPIRTETDVAAYLAFRLPATFAAVAAAMRETAAQQPHLAPTTLLDVGGGPGTAVWAAASIWPSIAQVAVLERDLAMIQLGQALASEADSPAIRGTTWVHGDALDPWTVEHADVVVGAYMLGELPSETRGAILGRMWKHTRETALIIEPGTPAGWAVAREVGEVLRDAGAEIVAPFPWEWPCVESERDWLHFAERVPRTRLHRVVKGADLAYEDEKYTYVAASRSHGIPIAARVIRHPQVRKGHVRLVLCTAEGIRHLVVARSDREAFRRARDLAWGSAIPPEDLPTG